MSEANAPERGSPKIEFIVAHVIYYSIIAMFTNLPDSTDREGEYKTWYENGQLEVQAFYRNGKEEGEHKSWHENGQLGVQAFYRDDEPEGKRKCWYANGQLHVQEFYRDGKLEGKRKVWYKNGQLWTREFYRDGKLEGEYKSWYENGQLQAQEFYRDGELEGECKSWYENGQPYEQKFYWNGTSIHDNFNFAKKQVFLRIGSCYRKRVIHSINMVLILMICMRLCFCKWTNFKASSKQHQMRMIKKC